MAGENEDLVSDLRALAGRIIQRLDREIETKETPQPDSERQESDKRRRPKGT
ncbi:MAG: hypothetical protein ACRD8W_00440 [Nitrososphaeraceae archaeon]